MASRRKRFVRVEVGSTVKLTVEREPTTVPFVVEAEGYVGTLRNERWTSAQLLGKTVSWKLAVEKRHRILLDLAFTSSTAATAIVRVEIVKPDGTTHGEPWQLEISGQRPAVSDVIVTMFMLTGEV